MNTATERLAERHAGEPFPSRCNDRAAVAPEAEPEVCHRHVWLLADGPCPQCAASTEVAA